METVKRLSKVEADFIDRINNEYKTGVSSDLLEVTRSKIMSNWTESGCATHIDVLDVPLKKEEDAEYRGVFSISDAPDIGDQFFIEAIFKNGWPYGIFITNSVLNLPNNPSNFFFIGNIERF